MEQSAAKRYDRLMGRRQFYLNEAHEAAALTIPSVMPETTDVRNRSDNPTPLTKPWQSLGARGVRNLVSKLMLTLFPPTASFFRWEVSPELLNAEVSDPEERAAIKTDIEKQLAERERAAMTEVETEGHRPKADQALRLAVVTGNALVYLPPTGGARVFPLHSYVVRRDFVGNVIEIIYVEVLDRQTLPPKIKAALDADPNFQTPADENAAQPNPERVEDEPVHLYTQVVREGKKFKVRQEVEGSTVEGSEFTVSIDETPFIVLRFVTVDGEDYGRSYISEFIGDLQGLEDLRRSIQIGSLNAAKINPIINPNSTITPRKLIKAKNGQPLIGNIDDVKMLQQEKYGDFRVARETAAELTQGLSASFLLNSSFQRKGERVTAEEIRRMAEELEDALGGVFSVLSQEFQMPLARRIDAQLVRRGAMPKMPKGVNPMVVTGLAALGRGHELQRLREGLSLAAEAANLMPEIGQSLQASDVLKRIFTGVGLDMDGLIKTEEQMQEEQQAAQQADLQARALESGAGPAGAAAGKIAGEAMVAGAEGQPPQQQ